ncbi:MAG: hypothetical protein QNJ90_15705, partial [Planctomycetota bacterium]|nr:hypothetical protein [Planctomycetota bacterium]
MRKRLLKYLKRLVFVGLIFAVLGVAAFTWFCYWPLEGSVDDVLTLVPEDVEFVLRGDYEDLRDTTWVQQNVLDDPLHPLLAEQAGEAFDQAEAEMARIEQQINQNIPVDFAKFGVVEDVIKGEVCVAGNFCRGIGADQGPPKWQEILVLTRVSWKTRCVAALKHGFIREQLGPNLRVSAEDDEIYKLVFPNVRVLPESQRMGCGGGFIIPPRNTWYLRRVKDVLAVSNSRRLINGVADLANDNAGGRSFASRPGYEAQRVEGRVTAAVNVEPLHTYLTSAFEYYPELKPLRRFLPPKALEKLNGSISLGGLDLLEGGARISYIGQQAPGVVRNVYSLPERAVRQGISELVPAQDTFAVLSLRVDPQYLLNSLVSDFLEPADRRLWERNLKGSVEGGFDSLEEFFADLSTRIGTEAMIALARLSDTFDKVEYSTFWDESVDPKPALAVMVRVKEGGSAKELEEYLSGKIPLMGFSRDMEHVNFKGFKFIRAQLQVKALDLALISPCFLLTDDYLVISSNEAYMRQIIETIADRETRALETDDTFRQTMATMPDRGHVGLFVDLEKLTRVPRDDERTEASAGPAGTRGFLWDGRNTFVITEKDPRTEAIRYRAQLEQE